MQKYTLLSSILDECADIKDFGDVQYEVKEQLEVENMREYNHVAFCNEQVSKNVEKIIKEGRICLTLGGDHSIGTFKNIV